MNTLLWCSRATTESTNWLQPTIPNCEPGSSSVVGHCKNFSSHREVGSPGPCWVTPALHPAHEFVTGAQDQGAKYQLLMGSDRCSTRPSASPWSWRLWRCSQSTRKAASGTGESAKGDTVAMGLALQDWVTCMLAMWRWRPSNERPLKGMHPEKCFGQCRRTPEKRIRDGTEQKMLVPLLPPPYVTFCMSTR
jgi:hypothetical protein